MRQSKVWRTLRGVLSLAVALSLVAWVIVRSGIEPVKVLATVDGRFFFAAFLFYGVGFLSASWRWFLLLGHIRVHLPFLTVLRLALIGLFFNLLVPGGVGGDLIKMVYMRRESGDRYPQALLTVLLDRVLGLAGLLLVAVLSVAWNLPMIVNGPPQLRALMMVVAGSSVVGLLAGLCFLLWPWISRWVGRWKKKAESLLPTNLLSIVGKLGDALDLLRAAPGKLLGLIVLSTVGHLTAAVGVYLIAKGTGDPFPLGFAPCLLATQLSNLVAAVPLTPGGLGGRDLIMSLLLGAAGAPAVLAGSVPVLVTVCLVSWSLLGGLALLWERGAGVSAGMATETPKDS